MVGQDVQFFDQEEVHSVHQGLSELDSRLGWLALVLMQVVGWLLWTVRIQYAGWHARVDWYHGRFGVWAQSRVVDEVASRRDLASERWYHVARCHAWFFWFYGCCCCLLPCINTDAHVWIQWILVSCQVCHLQWTIFAGLVHSPPENLNSR